MGYKMSKRDAQVIEESFERFGMISASYLMMKLRCTIKKATWILNNIETREQLHKHLKKGVDK